MLGDNPLGDKGVKLVAEGLRACVQPGQRGSVLQTLQLARCSPPTHGHSFSEAGSRVGASDGAAKAIAVMLTFNTTMQASAGWWLGAC